MISLYEAPKRKDKTVYAMMQATPSKLPKKENLSINKNSTSSKTPTRSVISNAGEENKSIFAQIMRQGIAYGNMEKWLLICLL